MNWFNVPTHRPRVPNCARATGSWQIKVMKRELFVPSFVITVWTRLTHSPGVPGLSLPCGLSSTGLPIGIQLIGKQFDEARLLRTAHNLERALGLDFNPPAFSKV